MPIFERPEPYPYKEQRLSILYSFTKLLYQRDVCIAEVTEVAKELFFAFVKEGGGVQILSEFSSPYKVSFFIDKLWSYVIMDFPLPRQSELRFHGPDHVLCIKKVQADHLFEIHYLNEKILIHQRNNLGLKDIIHLVNPLPNQLIHIKPDFRNFN